MINYIIILIIVILLIWFSTRESYSSKATALILSCMDYRLVDDTILHFNKKLKDDFNFVVLAGSSLGYNSMENWTPVIDKHIQLAKDLHGIKKVIIIDHMDCGAYYLLTDLDPNKKNDSKEYQYHLKNLMKAKIDIKNKFPKLSVNTKIIHLNGKVEDLD